MSKFMYEFNSSFVTKPRLSALQTHYEPLPENIIVEKETKGDYLQMKKKMTTMMMMICGRLSGTNRTQFMAQAKQC